MKRRSEREGEARSEGAPALADEAAFMRLALDEARKGLGRTHPNPAVGAVLVKNGKVIGRGFHAKAGQPHAEVMALRDAGNAAEGADIYTTLEPCDHVGRTPPCSMALLDAGVKRVFFASSDPNPVVNGKGVKRLKKAGIEVVGHLLKDEADRLNRPFFKFMRTGLPWVTLKAAVTLDGKLATASGDSKWITSEPARAKVHQLRDQVDAILIGAGTALADDPLLTTRLPDGAGRDPVRVVLDSDFRVPKTAKLFHLQSSAPTIVATLQAPDDPRAPPNAEVWQLAPDHHRPSLEELLRRLALRGCLHVMVEGGATLHGALIEAGLFDAVLLFVAPKILGAEARSWAQLLNPPRTVGEARVLQLEQVEQVGPDALLHLTATAPSR